jgi:hypothetical protein
MYCRILHKPEAAIGISLPRSDCEETIATLTGYGSGKPHIRVHVGWAELEIIWLAYASNLCSEWPLVIKVFGHLGLCMGPSPMEYRLTIAINAHFIAVQLMLLNM